MYRKAKQEDTLLKWRKISPLIYKYKLLQKVWSTLSTQCVRSIYTMSFVKANIYIYTSSPW